MRLQDEQERGEPCSAIPWTCSIKEPPEVAAAFNGLSMSLVASKGLTRRPDN